MENQFLIPIGQRLKEIRKAHNYTQEKVACVLDISEKHISHAERGVSCLSLKNLIIFCNHFGCSLDYIIFGKTENNALAKLPDEIVRILNTGSKADLDRLTRYLRIYVELSQKQN